MIVGYFFFFLKHICKLKTILHHEQGERSKER